MSDYLVRVELHAASHVHYDQLHKSMAAQGFSRTIRSSDGQHCALPTAEYVMSTSQDGATVRAAADAAAATTGLYRGVLVAQYSGAWWTGLQKI